MSRDWYKLNKTQICGRCIKAIGHNDIFCEILLLIFMHINHPLKCSSKNLYA